MFRSMKLKMNGKKGKNLQNYNVKKTVKIPVKILFFIINMVFKWHEIIVKIYFKTKTFRNNECRHLNESLDGWYTNTCQNIFLY